VGKDAMESAGPIRILAIDDHALLREGIAALVSTQSDMILVAEGSNGRDAIQRRDRSR
jgi:DNA-binding NarL/FixJ family response regulator